MVSRSFHLHYLKCGAMYTLAGDKVKAKYTIVDKGNISLECKSTATEPNYKTMGIFQSLPPLNE